MTKPKTTEKSRHVLTTRQHEVVINLLRAHCRTVNGKAVFDDSWNDERIRAEANASNPDPKFSIVDSSVKRVRRAILGDLRTHVLNGGGQVPDDVLWDEVKRIEDFAKTQALGTTTALRKLDDKVDTLRRDTHAVTANLDRSIKQLEAGDRLRPIGERIDLLQNQINTLHNWLNQISQYLQKTRSGYKTPEGRPQSTPEDPDAQPQPEGTVNG